MFGVQVLGRAPSGDIYSVFAISLPLAFTVEQYRAMNVAVPLHLLPNTNQQ